MGATIVAVSLGLLAIVDASLPLLLMATRAFGLGLAYGFGSGFVSANCGAKYQGGTLAALAVLRVLGGMTMTPWDLLFQATQHVWRTLTFVAMAALCLVAALQMAPWVPQGRVWRVSTAGESGSTAQQHLAASTGHRHRRGAGPGSAAAALPTTVVAVGGDNESSPLITSKAASPLAVPHLSISPARSSRAFSTDTGSYRSPSHHQGSPAQRQHAVARALAATPLPDEERLGSKRAGTPTMLHELPASSVSNSSLPLLSAVQS